MKIKLLALGKMKNSAFAELAGDYEQRIKKFNPLLITELPDEPVRKKSDRDQVLAKEALTIQKQLKDNSYLIALDEAGTQWSSVDLAWEIKNLFEKPISEIVFLIGSSHGLAPSIKQNAKKVWALSKLTLPHRLARVLALEQIYRALTILKNVPYHNE